jgi:diguanylate cyclase (GGDEF)-like protein/putative nucleotidyltransferase with HDIG domain
VDGPSQLMRALGPAFEAAGFCAVARTSTDDIAREVQEGEVDLLIVDMHVPHFGAFELCGELRRTDAGRLIPIMLMSPNASEEPLVVRGLLCGADDCFASALSEQRIAEIQARIRVQLRNRRERNLLCRVRQERDDYRRAAVVDTLTGLANRRSLDAALQRFLGAGRSFGVLFVDADHFKRINDAYGHGAGDEVLKALADCIRSVMRPGDICARYGGEEFVIAARGVDAAQASALGETLRAAVEALVFKQMQQKVTVSVGIAVFDPGNPDVDIEAICRRADQALYAAKELGRNRVRLAGGANDKPVPGARVSGVSLAAVGRPSSAPAEAVEGFLVRALGNGRAGLPLLPAAAAEALRLAEDPRTNMSNIAQLVDRDPPLAARFVALASSAVYSRGARVLSTQSALVRVGLAASRDLLLQVVYERTNAELPRYQEEVARSFQHSVRTAIAARRVAREHGRPHEHAYLCGLLHDIGEARIYRLLAQMEEPPSSKLAAELCARHHQRAGAEIARSWRLPSDVVDACALHHDRGPGASTSVRVVRAAEALVRVIDGASTLDAEAVVLAGAGVTPERMRIVLRDTEEALAPPPSEGADDEEPVARDSGPVSRMESEPAPRYTQVSGRAEPNARGQAR